MSTALNTTATNGTVVIIGLGSDIGRELAARFAADGWSVKGTYRSRKHTLGLAVVEATRCDLSSSASIRDTGDWLRRHCSGWRAVVVAAGTEEPVGPFWDCDPEQWDRGIQINALAPLKLLRALYAVRDAEGKPSVVFFSGSGTNNPAPAYSAYCASKIMLIKMCELLDSESDDTSFVIIGPGIVRTKIHAETLNAGDRAGPNLARMTTFLESSAPGTSHDDIYSCVRWCMRAGKKVVGGRNISLVYDAWREPNGLEQWLMDGADRYKLRRFGNEHRFDHGTRD